MPRVRHEYKENHDPLILLLTSFLDRDMYWYFSASRTQERVGFINAL